MHKPCQDLNGADRLVNYAMFLRMIQNGSVWLRHASSKMDH